MNHQGDYFFTESDDIEMAFSFDAEWSNPLVPGYWDKEVVAANTDSTPTTPALGLIHLPLIPKHTAAPTAPRLTSLEWSPLPVDYEYEAQMETQNAKKTVIGFSPLFETQHIEHADNAPSPVESFMSSPPTSSLLRAPRLPTRTLELCPLDSERTLPPAPECSRLDCSRPPMQRQYSALGLSFEPEAARSTRRASRSPSPARGRRRPRAPTLEAELEAEGGQRGRTHNRGRSPPCRAIPRPALGPRATTSDNVERITSWRGSVAAATSHPTFCMDLSAEPVDTDDLADELLRVTALHSRTIPSPTSQSAQLPALSCSRATSPQVAQLEPWLINIGRARGRQFNLPHANTLVHAGRRL